jgi:putative DNA primase/helicase
VVDGKTRKYEIPHKAKMAVGVPPRVRPRLGDPSIPLVITEGARKADAAVTAGLYAVDLVGVWNWRLDDDASPTSSGPATRPLRLDCGSARSPSRDY